MMRLTRSTLSENIRTETSELLNSDLAAAIDLHGQLKQAHWSVRRPSFIAVHGLFDRVAGEAETYSDLLAGRAAGLGAVAEGTVQVATERSFLGPYPLRIADESQHCLRSLRRLPRSGNRLAKRSNNQPRSTLIRQIHSPDIARRRPSTLARRIACCTDYERSGRLREGLAAQSRRFRENCDGADRDARRRCRLGE
jgi:DNA-binding ferritin-like protein